jgi:cyclopropane fatty-acyl-phospholipid synthase-like methyltransferase
MKPFAQSCEQNKDVILEVIKPLLINSTHLLEIGSGTGQHAVHFAKAMPHLQWQTSDLQESLQGIQMWLDEADLSNVLSPVVLDVLQSDWPELQVDAIFMANTLHIMSWHEVEELFSQMPALLQNNGIVLIYGPFNYHGQFTSDSNRQFDDWLKARDPQSGVKEFSAINVLAKENHLQLLADYEMPANNRILCWLKNRSRGKDKG